MLYVLRILYINILYYYLLIYLYCFVIDWRNAHINNYKHTMHHYQVLCSARRFIGPPGKAMTPGYASCNWTSLTSTRWKRPPRTPWSKWAAMCGDSIKKRWELDPQTLTWGILHTGSGRTMDVKLSTIFKNLKLWYRRIDFRAKTHEYSSHFFPTRSMISPTSMIHHISQLSLPVISAPFSLTFNLPLLPWAYRICIQFWGRASSMRWSLTLGHWTWRRPAPSKAWTAERWHFWADTVGGRNPNHKLIGGLSHDL